MNSTKIEECETNKTNLFQFLHTIFALVGILCVSNAFYSAAFGSRSNSAASAVSSIVEISTIPSSNLRKERGLMVPSMSSDNVEKEKETFLSPDSLNLMTVKEALVMLQSLSDTNEQMYVGRFDHATEDRVENFMITDKEEEGLFTLQETEKSIAAANSRINKRERMLEETEEEEEVNKDAFYYWSNAIGAFICVIIAALAAGLTMGLLSIDLLTLLIKERAASTEEEQKQARKLIPIVKDHHRLLVTLLLLNSIANEALPIFLDGIVPSYVAIILSVTLVLFFGEIIPSAFFTGPNQMTIASNLVPLVKLVMWILCPLAYPIAKMLDYFLHDEDEASAINLFNRGELAALVRITYEERLATKSRRRSELIKMASEISNKTLEVIIDADNEDGEDGHHNLSMRSSASQRSHSIRNSVAKYEAQQTMKALRRADNQSVESIGGESLCLDEVAIAEAALHLGTKVAVDVYTPLSKVFSIPFDGTFDEERIIDIYSSGYSRIPVYEGKTSAIKGVLMTKQLVLVNPADERKVDTFPLMQPLCVGPKEDVLTLINQFQTGGHANRGGHLAIVCSKPKLANDALDSGLPIPKEAGVMGIVTFEDVLEELLQEAIYDEMDHAERSAGSTVNDVFQKWWRGRQLEKMKTAKRKIAASKMLTTARPGGKSIQVLESAALEAAKAATVAAEASSKTAVIAAKLATNQENKTEGVSSKGGGEKDEAAAMAEEAAAASVAAAAAAARINAVENTLEIMAHNIDEADDNTDEPTSLTSPLLNVEDGGGGQYGSTSAT